MRSVVCIAPGRRPSRGFSLIEALVAVTLLALMGGVTYGTFARSLDARERATQLTDRSHELRQALLRMASEISQAFLSKHKDYSDPRTQTIFLAQRHTGGMRLDMTTFSHFKFIADANESDQNELSYFVRQDPNDSTRTHLMRREQARIDDKPTEGGRVQVLARDVQDLQLRFYDAKTQRWEEGWDASNREQKDRLPKFVSIELSALDHIGKPVKVSTKARIYLQDAILITGAGFVPGID